MWRLGGWWMDGCIVFDVHVVDCSSITELFFCRSVGQPTTFSQTKISQQLLDVFSWDFVKTFIVSRG